VPIVVVHGVAVRDEDSRLARAVRPFGELPWPTVEELLREHVAPAISDDPAGVPVMRVYWGDLGAHFAWGGRSLVSRAGAGQGGGTADDSGDDVADDRDAGSGASDVAAEAAGAAADAAAEVAGDAAGAAERALPPPVSAPVRRVRRAVTAIRRPFEDFLPVFIGDVMTYIATRGTADAPGPIIGRVLAGLDTAAFAADARDEPLVVVTHSMGGQIVYDLVTHFLPRMPEHRHIRIDYWCAAASQVGLFEELGLFLESDPDRGGPAGRPTPYPPREHLGGWWNVWDHADLLSFRAEGIIEGVDDSSFFAAGTLATDHNKYLVNAGFHRALAERVRTSLGRG
jgi:hypothetical protein